MRRRFRLLPIAWLLLLLCVPAIGWALGARQPLLDNRPKTEWPRLGVAALRDASTYQQIDAALLERLPPRERALRAHARIAIDAFHDSPNPDVAIGSDGYRYYVPDLQTCLAGTSTAPVSDPGDVVDILARSIVASGRQALVVVPGQKLLIHDEDAPTIDDGRLRCARAIERAVAARLDAAPGGWDIDAPLRALEADGRPVFRRNDTHLNHDGRLVYANRVLDFIRPGLARQVGLRLGPPYERVGDLATMLGLRTTDEERPLVPTRTPKPPVRPGSVVLIGDSQMEQTFTEPPGPGLAPLVSTTLPGTPTCTQPVLYGGQCDAPIKAASKIVYETVGRNLSEIEGVCWRVVSLVTEKQVTGPAGRYERLDGQGPTGGRELTIGPTGTLKLRVVVPGPDASPTPRLLLLGLRDVPDGVPVAMAQEAQGGKPAPCATPQQYAGGSLVLPVPAHRRASDLVVTLTGPPSTRVIAPRVVPLTGRSEKVER
jgi:hypothetical protein